MASNTAIRQLRNFAILAAAGIVITAVSASLFSAQQIDDIEDLPPYGEKSAAQWMELLKNSQEPKTRGEAAEALGFMVRSGRMTYGGFSDVPIDSEEPPQLNAQQIKPITDALIVALADPASDVRAAAAIAISWIGPRAEAAIPALIPMVDDFPEDAWDPSPAYNAMTALAIFGSDAKAAIPRLQPLMARNDPKLWVKVAGTSRELGAPPEMFVPKMIETLAIADRDHYAAMELAKLGNPAVPALLEALKSPNLGRRGKAAYALANMAGWDNLTERKEEVVDALIEMLQPQGAALTPNNDTTVIYHGLQAIGAIQAAPEKCIPVLVGLLDSDDFSVANEAARSLGGFGKAAQPALPALLECLQNQGESALWSVAGAISEIGVDEQAANQLQGMKLSMAASHLFLPMCEYPDAALEFLRNNPQALDARDYPRLLEILRSSQPEYQELQAEMLASEYLPLPVIAQFGDARLLPVIERRMDEASKYMLTKLRACAIACGKPPEQTLEISESQPGDFVPPSAWPGTDSTRISEQMRGHGDGYAEVIITGQILQHDGTPASEPKFYRTNDSMLLGNSVDYEEPIIYESKTGRFVFCTTVFAAYNMGGKPPEPGPYQTGSSLVRVEADNCQPLVIKFYDEMPHVKITLSPKPAAQNAGGN